MPIIIVTGFDSFSLLPTCMDAGATDFIKKPFHPVELLSRVNSAIRLKHNTDNLDSAQSLLFTLARIVEAKDEITGDHCSRLAHGGVVFGNALGLDFESLLTLERGGILHDIGKLGIPDSILLKPGKLTEDEWEVMKLHVVIGEKLCRGLVTMKSVIPIIYYHHERWDGSGYPEGLKGEEIPLLVRVFQLVDIYDALANDRPYKKAFSNEKIIGIFKEEVEKGWRDPELVAVFLEIIEHRFDKQIYDSLVLGPDGIIYGLDRMGIFTINSKKNRIKFVDRFPGIITAGIVLDGWDLYFASGATIYRYNLQQ